MTRYVAGGGRPNFFFVKSAVTEPLHATLALLGIGPGSVPSLAACAASIEGDADIPPRAPDGA
eukprot:743094-Alexandrium_andersonii.AAC.1